MMTSTSDPDMAALLSRSPIRTNEPKSTSADSKFSYEFVIEQLNDIINSSDCPDELKKAAGKTLIEIEREQVRTINANVSSDGMSPSSLYSFSFSHSPSPPPPPTPPDDDEKEPSPKPRRLRDRDLYKKKKKREKKPRRPRKTTDNFDFESTEFYNYMSTSSISTDADDSTKVTSHESTDKSTNNYAKLLQHAGLHTCDRYRFTQPSIKNSYLKLICFVTRADC